MADVVKNDVEIVKSLYNQYAAELSAAAEMAGLPSLTVWHKDEVDAGMWYMPTNTRFFEDAVPALKALDPAIKTGLKTFYYARRHEKDLAVHGVKPDETILEQLEDAVEYSLQV